MSEPDDGPRCLETHISWVLLNGSRAFKIAKAVRTDVLDQIDVEDRRRACEREVALNRRLAPDVYRGVGSLSLDGEELEPVIVMERMPANRRFAHLVKGPGAADHVRSVARKVASFHASLPPLATEQAERVASADALSDRWLRDVEGARAIAGTPARLLHRIGTLAREYIAGRGPLFAQRIADGMVRDGHGDLLADDIYCLDDGPRILDCLAFSDSLRHGDVLADVAFLVMDLQRLGNGGLARRLLHDYCEFSDEHHPGSLAHFYVAQRALVRAKVTALRIAQQGGDSTEVGDLLGLALDHLERATVRLVLVGGIPGSGKSTTAERLGGEMGWAVLSSDSVRRDLGLRTQDRARGTGYEPEAVHAVYRELRARAEWMLGLGISVVLDASWASAAERSATRAMAEAAGADVVELRCDAPVELCRRRVAERTESSESEATPAVVALLASRADPWPEAVVIQTGPVGRDAITETVAASGELWWSATRDPAPTGRLP